MRNIHTMTMKIGFPFIGFVEIHPKADTGDFQKAFISKRLKMHNMVNRTLKIVATT